MQIKSYGKALNYLEGFIGKIVFKINKEFLKKHDPLERMRIFLSLLGNPQEKFKSVLVGGTSGKGSTAYLISHILRTAGYKTGFTVSPHLQKVNERLQINGKQISDLEFTKMVNSVVQTIELMKKMKVGGPSYFEILAAMAFLYFAKEKVDLAVVEVGMGGEFDATNTLNPLVAVLTNVGLDHTNILGTTVEKIARTKAGIIKSIKYKVLSSKYKNSLTVVSGVKQKSIVKIVEDRCKKVGAKLNLLWRDFNYKIKKSDHEGSVFDLTTSSGSIKKLNDLKLSLIGNYQLENASLAIETVLQLGQFEFKISEEQIKKALSTAFFPGRFEVKELKIENCKLKIVLDGAHNPTKMRAFLSALKKLYPREHKIFIIGFKFDKDISKMLKEILGVADKIIVTEFKAKTDTSIHASADALNVKSQMSKVKSNIRVTVEKDSQKALQIGLKTIQQYNNLPRRKVGSAVLVVTGSLYLVGEIRDML